MNNPIEKSHTPTLTTIARQLSNSGYPISDKDLHDKQPTTGVAWYQHLLLAVGVFVAFVCFLLLLTVSDFFNQTSLAQSVWAVFFILTAIGFYHHVVAAQSREERTSAVFVTQASFVLIIAGQGLLLFQLPDYLNFTHLWQLTLLTALLAAVTFPLYPVVLSRVISVSAVLFLLLYALPFSMTPVFFALLVGMVVLSFSLRLSAWRYLRYACIMVIFLRLTLPLSASGHIVFFNSPYQEINPYPLYFPSLIIAVILCACILYLAAKQRRYYGIWLLCITVLVLSYFLPATLFFALLLMLLGYATHDKVITGLGLLLLPYYLFEYYYNLQRSLLDKSLLLMASGSVLLSLAWVTAKLPPTQHTEVADE